MEREQPASASSRQFRVERICDSGAATALGPIEAWVRQGLPQQRVNENLTISSSPANFATGGGARSSKSAWTVSSDVAGDQQAYNLGRACPLVFSQGQAVLEDRKTYVWHPDLYAGKPFLCPAEDITVTVRDGGRPQVATRVQDYTPYFDETITLRPALVSADDRSSAPDLEESSSDIEEWASHAPLEGGATAYASDVLGP